MNLIKIRLCFINKYIKFVICIVFVITLIIIYNSKTESNIINGTFISNELPFVSISFDKDNNYSFYYYYINSKNEQIEDIGHYKIKDKNIYVLNNNTFNDTEIIYIKNEFIIIINDIKYNFKKISDLPTKIQV